MSVNLSINNKYTHEDFERIQNPYFQKEDNCPICLTSNIEAECKKVELVCRHVFCDECFMQIPSQNRSHCAVCRQSTLPNRYFFKEEGDLKIQAHISVLGLTPVEQLLIFEEFPLERWESLLNVRRPSISRRPLPIGGRSIPLASVLSLLGGDRGISNFQRRGFLSPRTY